MTKALRALLCGAALAPSNAHALASATWGNDPPFRFSSRKSQEYLWLGFGLSTGMTEFFKQQGYSPWQATAMGALLASVAQIAEEYGHDSRPERNEVLAAGIGVTAAVAVQIPFNWPRKDHAPLLESVQVEGRAEYSLRAPDVGERAVEEALKNAVRQVVQLYTPEVPARRLAVYEERVVPRYKEFIAGYDRLSLSREPRTEAEKQTREETLRARVRGDPLYLAMLGEGLRKPGRHFEFQVLRSRLKGGSGGTNPAPGGGFVQNRAYSADLLGFSARYYFNDWLYGDLSDQMLTSPVEVGTAFDSAGRRSPVTLHVYSPMETLAGVKWLDRRGFRATSSAGVGYTQVEVGTQRSIQTYVFGNELQWIPTRWLGIGLRAEYRTRTHYDLMGEKMAQRWRISEELVLGF